MQSGLVKSLHPEPAQREFAGLLGGFWGVATTSTKIAINYINVAGALTKQWAMECIGVRSSRVDFHIPPHQTGFTSACGGP